MDRGIPKEKETANGHPPMTPISRGEKETKANGRPQMTQISQIPFLPSPSAAAAGPPSSSG